MNMLRARETLIEALIRDACNTDSKREYLEYVLTVGHRGFENYTNQELLHACYSAGVQEENDEVNEACETLEAE